MPTESGLFITFEGGDGAGKTTQAKLLCEWLTAERYIVVRTREPGGTETGQAIRNLLLHTHHPIDAKAEALLYAADRAQHVSEVVRPALASRQVVVQDRYIDSSLAYQGAGRVLEADDVRYLSEWATGALWPDLTILLDLSPKDAVLRRDDRGEVADRLERETLDFHSAVRNGFLTLAEQNPERFLVINAQEKSETIHTQIRRRVAEALASIS